MHSGSCRRVAGEAGLALGSFSVRSSLAPWSWGCESLYKVCCLGRRRGPSLGRNCQGHSPLLLPSTHLLLLENELLFFLNFVCACMRAKLLQLCLTLCNLMNCSPPGASVHGILQARILEWVAMPFSRGSS